MFHGIHRFLPLVLGPLLLVPALGPVGQTDAPAALQEPAGSGTAHHIHIQGFAFQPASLTVAEGDTVTWHNHDGAPHTASARDGSFESGTLPPGATFTWTVAGDGRIAYICSIHPYMTAELVVPTTPSAPRDVRAVPSGPNMVSVSWSAPTFNGGTPLTGYNVYRAVGMSGEPTLLASVAGTSYQDTGAPLGVVSYAVSAINDQGEGPRSSEAVTVAVGLP